MANPYDKAIQDAREVMAGLIALMVASDDMKFFKNVAAVYVVWQHEAHNLQLQAMEWKGV